MLARSRAAQAPKAGLPGAPASSPWVIVAIVLLAVLIVDMVAPSVTSALLPSLRTHRLGGAAAAPPGGAELVSRLAAQVEALAAQAARAQADADGRAAELEGTKAELQQLRLAKAAAAVAKVAAAAAPAAAAAAAAAPIKLADKEQRVHSQNGEDGVLAAIFGAVGTTNKFYVEFGTESGSETNSRVLREQLGWTGLLLDGGNENPQINLHKHFLTAENIVGLFEKYEVPRELDLLSVDVDRNDWYILRSLVAPSSPAAVVSGDFASARFRPRVIVVEYNSDWEPPQDKVVIYDSSARWDGTNYFGASLTAFNALAIFSGYTLVYADQMGVNLFFVRDDLQPKALFADAGNEGALHRFAGYADCQLYHRPSGHCEDSKIGTNRPYLKATDLLSSAAAATGASGAVA